MTKSYPDKTISWSPRQLSVVNHLLKKAKDRKSLENTNVAMLFAVKL